MPPQRPRPKLKLFCLTGVSALTGDSLNAEVAADPFFRIVHFVDRQSRAFAELFSASSEAAVVALRFSNCCSVMEALDSVIRFFLSKDFISFISAKLSLVFVIENFDSVTCSSFSS